MIMLIVATKGALSYITMSTKLQRVLFLFRSNHMTDIVHDTATSLYLLMHLIYKLIEGFILVILSPSLLILLIFYPLQKVDRLLIHYCSLFHSFIRVLLDLRGRPWWLNVTQGWGMWNDWAWGAWFRFGSLGHGKLGMTVFLSEGWCEDRVARVTSKALWVWRIEVKLLLRC